MGYCQRQSLFKAVQRIFPFPLRLRIYSAFSVLEIAVLGSDIVASAHRECLGWPARKVVRVVRGKEGRKAVRGTGAEATLSPKFLSEGGWCLLLWCFWALLLFSRASWKEQCTRGKKYHRGRKEAIIAGCLFVANRMLKWQICKFVREGSLVFIFISQSGFLLAEQQARKRPILTT